MNEVDREEPGTPDTLVLVGEVTAPFGVRGQLKMRALMQHPEALTKLPGVRLHYPGGSRQETRRLTSVKNPDQGATIVTFEGVADRNAAELLRNVQVFVLREELPPLPEGEYYEQDLLGLRVVTESGRDFGVIEQVHYYPANDVYETAEAMIPAVEDIVLQVDLAGRRLVVKDIPGLHKDE